MIALADGVAVLDLGPAVQFPHRLVARRAVAAARPWVPSVLAMRLPHGAIAGASASREQAVISLAPSLAEIEALAQRALATIPHELKRHLGPVVIRVEEFPDEETEEEMELESPFDILGLYRGVALPHKSRVERAARDRHDLPLPPADPRLLVRDRRAARRPSCATS